MKKNNISSGVAGIVVLVLLGSAFLGSVNGAIEITEYPSFKPGDYFKYDADVSGLIDQMKDMFGGDATVNLETKSFEIRYDREETVNLYGESYDCIVSTMTMDMKFSLSGTMQGTSYTAEVHMVMKGVSWDTKEDMKEVREEMAQYLYMNITVSGQKTYSESQSITETEYNPPVSEYNIPVRMGDSWQTVTEKKIHTTNKQRTNGGSWQVTENDKTESATMMYQAIDEAHIGAFDTLKIKETDSSFSNNCTYEYITSDGIPVKVEWDSNNTPLLSAELSEYNYQSSDSGDSGGSNASSGGDSGGSNASSGGDSGSSGGGIPGFEAVAAIGGLSIAGLAYGYRKKH